MADERLRSKSELKRLFTNLKRKGITDDMIAILINVLWRDKITSRTSGFDYPGGTDAIISFDDLTRTFAIEPVDPLITDWKPRYAFYSWSYQPIYHRRFDTETITLPDEEGLFAIYFDKGDNSRLQELKYIKNPTQTELKDIYLKKVLISFIYWDYDNQTALYFGDDRHGSEWNPQMHWMLHRTIKGQVDSGLTITDMLINEDGSLDSHAQFTVQAGTMWHDDFILDIPGAGDTGTIPVLYFLGIGQHYPRFVETSGFGCYKVTTRIGYNATAESIVEATNGYHVMYHIFAVNEHVTTARKVLTVMGQNEYETLPEAYTNLTPELDAIYGYMPQQGTCYLGTVVFQTSNAYTNSVAARIVAFFEKDKIHPPVAIALDSVDLLDITESQVLSWKGPKPITVTQATHGFTVGNAIRHNGTSFVLAQANNSENAQTCGIVTKVIDANSFQYQSDGFLIDAAFVSGKEYFLSPVTSGLVMELPTPEVWSVGEVRQSLGWGTPQGLKIEIDVGDEIIENNNPLNLVTSLTIANEKLTLTQSGGDDVFVPFPYYTKTELNTSGAGGQVHWGNVTDKPTTIAGYSITDAYTKINLQTSGQAAVHWDNLTGVPNYDNYGYWELHYEGYYGNDVRSLDIVDFITGAGIDIGYSFADHINSLTFSHEDTSDQLSSTNTGTTVIQSVVLDEFGHVTSLATKTIPAGVTDHGALTGLTDDDHPQYALVNGDYGNYFQVADLRIGAATGWKLIDNGTVLELQYNGVKKFEFKTNGEAFGTDFIAY